MNTSILKKFHMIIPTVDLEIFISSYDIKLYKNWHLTAKIFYFIS